MAKWLHEEFSSQGYRISTFVTPTWLLRVYAKLNIDQQAKSVVHRVGPELRFNNQKVRLLELDLSKPYLVLANPPSYHYGA
uniref:MTS domain-containing protein n=1 Tax=Steinernema glaseri TaxID=37863 RepID=A0A1I7Y096_9BILA